MYLIDNYIIYFIYLLHKWLYYNISDECRINIKYYNQHWAAYVCKPFLSKHGGIS